MLSPKLFSSLMGQANQSGEKSTVVHTLIWLIGVLFTVVVLLVIYQAPIWVLASVLIVALLGCLFFGYVFIFCLKNDPDLLRSEKLVLQKLAIERRVIGDSATGERDETKYIEQDDDSTAKIGNSIDAAEDK
ncbi:hypothetical protein [Serratia sp. FDAARGOS_506]|uniref:hypothetical protein n=1 Tax=Serratia TaxID=613 RepID=UPI000F4ED0C0|nr:hypothetical protein [Serratia sp. FDAARGOS_506]AYZ32600.1 hypothetical protein EGY12_16470 [Serratia sp. FDAARGOS_506]